MTNAGEIVWEQFFQIADNFCKDYEWLVNQSRAGKEIEYLEFVDFFAVLKEQLELIHPNRQRIATLAYPKPTLNRLKLLVNGLDIIVEHWPKGKRMTVADCHVYIAEIEPAMQGFWKHLQELKGLHPPQQKAESTAVPDKPKGDGNGAGEKIEADSYLTHIDIAKRYKKDPEATRKTLDRWRMRNDDGWREVTERKQREPKYLYQLSAIKSLFE
ncbi:MAG: hypothetical protein SFX18_18275 [Pirellulales bacterium]|nr:hypothetical protein [Pirellulales bacterium]